MAMAIEARRCFQRSASCRCQSRCTMPDQPMVTHSAARNWVSVHRWSCSDRNSLSRRRLAVMISGELLRSNPPHPRRTRPRRHPRATTSTAEKPDSPTPLAAPPHRGTSCLAGVSPAVRRRRRPAHHPRHPAIPRTARLPAGRDRQHPRQRCSAARPSGHLRHRTGQRRHQRLRPDEPTGPRSDDHLPALHNVAGAETRGRSAKPAL